MKTKTEKTVTTSTETTLSMDDIESIIREKLQCSPNAKISWYQGQLVSITVFDKVTRHLT